MNRPLRPTSCLKSGRYLRYRPLLESLEDRTVPTTFTVLNTNDSGTDSLRWAIDQVNADTDPTSTINFNISGSGMHTIRPTSSLTPIIHPLIINGYSQTGASCNTLTS